MNRSLLSFVLATVILTVTGNTATYYVSPDGSDTNTGLAPKNAMKTFQAAVDKLESGDTLLVHGGIYRETVIFPKSGTAEKPIIVQNDNGEKVVVSGCEPLAGWTKHEGNIWKAPMPWTLGLGRNQLFEGNDVLIEARYPNEPAPNLGMFVSDLSRLWPTYGEFSIPNPVEEPGRIVSDLLKDHPIDHWKGAIYQGNHYEGWCMQTGVIESSAPGEIHVGENRTKGWWFGPAYDGGYAKWSPEEGRGQIVGHINALDIPGEWCWKENTVYLIPLNAQHSEPKNIEAKRRQLAFDLSGREHIQITGIDVHAASVRLDDSAYCSFDQCDFTCVSHFLHHYQMAQLEEGKNTIKSGETGIYVGGHDNSFTNCSIRISAGAGFHIRGYRHTIHNCLIDEISYTAHYCNAITDSVGDFPDYENFLVGGHVISFNTMRNAGRHFFNYHGNGTSTASRDRNPMDYMATLFVHNHLYNGMLLTKDAGFLTGFYGSGGTLDGLHSQLAYNVMHDCYDIFAMRINVLGLVYLDAGTCNVDPHHNLLWAAPGSLQRGLWYNTACVGIGERDNLFHPYFSRNSSQLVSEDFPDGKPFRFGHDFGNPPPIPDWPPLEKKSVTFNGQLPEILQTEEIDFDENWTTAMMRFSTANNSLNTNRRDRQAPRHKKSTDPLVFEAIVNDGVSEGVRSQWTFVHGFKGGAWIKYADVPLGEGYKEIRIVYGHTNDKPRRVEIRLDHEAGPLVGTVVLPKTDFPRDYLTQLYGEAFGTISADAGGTHDVFFVFLSDDDENVGEFEYAQFINYRGQIPLQKNDAILELRVGSKDGEKIGEFRPRPTYGVSRDIVAKLRPVTGRQPLFVVCRSDSDAPVGTMESLTLQKSVPPPVPEGVGVPPLIGQDGRMILPQPTHPPQAKPADLYKKSGGQRPVFIATENGNGEPPVYRLDKSFDGTKSYAKPGRATILHDGENIYLEVANPLVQSPDLKRNPVWGSVDGVCVTFGKVDFSGGANSKTQSVELRGFPNGYYVAPQGVHYRAEIKDDSWNVHWVIPFAAVGIDPVTSDSAVSFNVSVRKPAENAWTCLADWERGGFLVFPAFSASTSYEFPKAGLQLWFDANDSESIIKDDRNRVALWKDKSEKGRDAVQKSESRRPILDEKGINGLSALTFSEKAKTFFEVPDLSDERMTVTAFAVVCNTEMNAPDNHDSRILTASDGQGEDYRIGIALALPGMETGGPRIKTYEIADRWGKNVRIGCFSPWEQTFFKGQIGEVLLFDRKLTQDERDLVQLYLTIKWSLW